MTKPAPLCMRITTPECVKIFETTFLNSKRSGMCQDLLNQFFEKYRDPWRPPFLLKDWQGFLSGFARIDPSGASRETPWRTNPCFSFPNWIHFDFIVDSIVGFWQSGANGLLIHTSLGNGFTTGAPLHSSRHGADQFQWVVKLPGILYARNPVNAYDF